MKTSLALFACVALASSGAAQSVLTVDVENRPGTGFTSLAAAVAAAADGDVLLLRGGLHDAVALGDKSLTLQGAGVPGELAQLRGLSVTGLAAGERVVARGMYIISPQHARVLEIADCAGLVWLEDMTVTGRMAVTASSQVVLTGFNLSWGYDPAPAAIAEPLTLVGSRVFASNGSFSGPSGPGLPGAPAIHMTDGELWLQHVGVSGGWGARGTTSDCNGYDGASAIVMTGVQPRVFVQGGNLTGGRGGAGYPGCTSGREASSVDQQAGSLQSSTAPARRLSLRSPLREGERMVTDSRGEIGDRVFLLHWVGRRSPFAPSLGWLTEPDHVWFSNGYAPGSDCADWENTVPELGPGVDALNVSMQALHWNRDRHETVLSNPIHFVVLDRRF